MPRRRSPSPRRRSSPSRRRSRSPVRRYESVEKQYDKLSLLHHPLYEPLLKKEIISYTRFPEVIAEMIRHLKTLYPEESKNFMGMTVRSSVDSVYTRLDNKNLYIQLDFYLPSSRPMNHQTIKTRAKNIVDNYFPNSVVKTEHSGLIINREIEDGFYYGFSKYTVKILVKV